MLLGTQQTGWMRLLFLPFRFYCRTILWLIGKLIWELSAHCLKNMVGSCLNIRQAMRFHAQSWRYDNTRLRAHLDFRPSRTWQQTVADVLRD